MPGRRVVWSPGFKTLNGKREFAGEILNEAFTRKPRLAIDRLVEEGDTVVRVGSGNTDWKDGDTPEFVFSDVFTFIGEPINCLCVTRGAAGGRLMAGEPGPMASEHPQAVRFRVLALLGFVVGFHFDLLAS